MFCFPNPDHVFGKTKHTSLICEKNPFVRKCWPEVIIIIFAINSHNLVKLIFSVKKRSDVKQESKHQRLGKTSKKIPLYTDDERLYNQLNHQHHSYCYPCVGNVVPQHYSLTSDCLIKSHSKKVTPITVPKAALVSSEAKNLYWIHILLKNLKLQIILIDVFGTWLSPK